MCPFILVCVHVCAYTEYVPVCKLYMPPAAGMSSVHAHKQNVSVFVPYIPPAAGMCPGKYLGMCLCMQPYLPNSCPDRSCLMSNL
jgi:hypothetical protein